MVLLFKMEGRNEANYRHLLEIVTEAHRFWEAHFAAEDFGGLPELVFHYCRACNVNCDPVIRPCFCCVTLQVNDIPGEPEEQGEREE